MKALFSSLLLIIGLTAQAQIGAPLEPIICNHDHDHSEVFIPFSGAGLRSSATSNIIYSFDANVPTAARQAMEYAASIWEQTLVSPVPIQVDVSWDTFEEDQVLASAGPTSVFRDFSPRAEFGVWYPVALAESIAGTELNDNEADIQIVANSEQRWYFGVDGNVPRGRIDMVSVILHELAHGLGFLSSADVNDNGEGELGFAAFNIIFDEFVEDGRGQDITNSTVFGNPSFNLFNAYTGNNLFFGNNQVSDANGGQSAKLHAPSSFDSGSSISHLDEFSFPTGDESSLLSPRLSFGEAIHEPGIVTEAIMEAIGWEINSSSVVVSTNDITRSELTIFPNPARDQVQIIWPDDFPSQVDYQLTDAYGRTVQIGQIAELQVLPLANLLPGNYYLRLSDNDSLYVAKLVVLGN